MKDYAKIVKKLTSRLWRHRSHANVERIVFFSLACGALRVIHDISKYIELHNLRRLRYMRMCWSTFEKICQVFRANKWRLQDFSTCPASHGNNIEHLCWVYLSEWIHPWNEPFPMSSVVCALFISLHSLISCKNNTKFSTSSHSLYFLFYFACCC